MSRTTTKKSRSRAKPTASIPPFLHKIYEILENPAHNDLVSWNEDGTAFIIKNVTEFTENVLPKYFKHNNFASFVRQLNLYDFHKSRYENNGSEFYHKMFKRGEKQLLSEIKRKMPNENSVESPSPSHFLYVTEDFGAEQAPQGPFHSQTILQDILNRQERLENALKSVCTQNKQLTKDNKLLWSEVTNLKNKQSNTEKATRIINTQNNQLLKENRYLWGELVRNREKYERQIEKLMLFLISVVRVSGKNPQNMFKKKNTGTTINPSGTEDSLFEESWPQTSDNNNFSVLPVKQMTKFLSNKKNKSQLDKLLERLEEEGIQNLFGNKPYIFEEKDLLVKLTSLLDLDTGAGTTKNFPSLEFMAEKRSPIIDENFGIDDTSEALSKLCKIENSNKLDPTEAIITEEKHPLDTLDNHMESTNHPQLLQLTEPSKIEEISEDMTEIDVLHMPADQGSYNFDMTPLNTKYQSNLTDNDFLQIPDSYFNSFHKNLDLHGHISEEEHDHDEDDDEEEKKGGAIKGTPKLMKDLSFSQLDLQKSDSKLDEAFAWFSPTNFMNNNMNLHHDDGQNHFFNNSGNAGGSFDSHL